MLFNRKTNEKGNSSPLLKKSVIEKSKRDDFLYETIAILKGQVAELQEMKDTDSLPRTFLERYKEDVTTLPKAEELKENSFTMFGGSYYNIDDTFKQYLYACRDKVETSPILQNIVEVLRMAVMPSNIRLEIPNEQLDEYFTNVLKRDKFNERLRDWIGDKFVDGEVIPLVFFNEKEFAIREIDPEYVDEFYRHEDDRDTFLSLKKAIISKDDNIVTKETYKYYKSADYDYQDEKPCLNPKIVKHDDELENDCFFFYARYGRRNKKRGTQPLIPVLRFDKLHEISLVDLAKLNHERSRVPWIKTIKNQRSSATSSHTTPPYRDSVIKIETDDVKWRTEDLNLADVNNKEYGRPLRLSIAAGVGYPEFIVSSDSSNTSYASLRKADSPFTLKVKFTSNSWADFLEDMFRGIIRELMTRGIIKERIKVKTVATDVKEQVNNKLSEISKDNKEQTLKDVIEIINGSKTTTKTINTIDVPINVIFPSFTPENELLQAQAIETLVQNNVMSRRTAQKRLGLDPYSEDLFLQSDNMKVEKGTTTDRKETKDQNYSNKLDREQDK